MSSSDYFHQRHLRGLHSHNDQEQTNPLTDALAVGCASIEMDVFLVSGAVLVGHTLGDTVPGVTLTSVYLAPIAALPVNQHPAQLKIDLKNNPSDDLFTAVVAAIAAHPEFDDGHLMFVITGHPPVTPTAHPAHVRFDRQRSAAALTDSECVLINVFFTDYSAWDGVAPVPQDVKELLTTWANDAHNAGKQLLVSFCPSTPASWQIQFDAGCDWISPGGSHPPGADDIAGLAAWFAAL